MIHAHEILKLIGNNDRAFTKESLRDTVDKSFGSNAVFTNCSGNPYAYDEIFQFFLDRSKIEISDDGFLSLQLNNICS